MPTAIVAGAGIAGLAAATALTRAGWSVSIYERAPTIEPMGAALSLWPNAISALRMLGLDAAGPEVGMPIRTMLLADQDGKPILGPRRLPADALMITRTALQRLLLEGLGKVSLQLGDGVTAVEQFGDGVSVHLEHGQCASADLLVDAGGIRSVIDAAITQRPATFRGYGGVLALSDRVDGGLDGLAAEYWGWGERFGVFELPERRRYWFYMRDQSATSQMPTYQEVATRSSGWQVTIAEAIAATPPERLIPFVVRAKRPPLILGEGRVISVGDAAHAMEPNLGQGACQGLEDAAALMAIASLPPAGMLAAFERLRLKRIRRIVRRSAEARYGAHGARSVQMVARRLITSLPATISERAMRNAQTMPDYRHVAG